MSVDEYFTKTPETLKPMELIFGAVRASVLLEAYHLHPERFVHQQVIHL